MKKPDVTFSKPSKADMAYAMKRLRYMDPANVAKDHKSPEARAAITAVLRWLSLNSNVAWRLKTGAYTDVAMSKSVRRDGPWDATILSKKALEQIEKLFDFDGAQ